FAARVAADRVTILEVVPSYLSLLLDYIDDWRTFPLPLHYLLVTGEELKPYLVKKWFDKYPAIKMVNAYGPTEASDDITHYKMDKTPGIEPIPIGKSLQNLNIYIVDNRLQLCPIGVKGEICVSGAGVGRGYLNNPEKTTERFIKNPFTTLPLQTPNGKYTIPGSILYRTGDLGSWRPDGNIAFFGRIDFQVKIRGFRIELGEIENRILNHAGVKEAVVIDREDETGNKYLCAYVVSGEPNSPDVAGIKDYLQQGLPDYMIPAHFIPMERIPLTPSGKVERKMLPAPGDGEIVNKYTSPQNLMERKLAAIWANVLAKEKDLIGIDHNFFDLGGHSLKAIVLTSKIHKEFNVKIPLAELFKAPTIRELARHILKAAKNRYASIKPVEKKEYYTLSSAQKRLYILQQMELSSVAYNQPQLIPLSQEPDIEKLQQIFTTLIDRHEILRTSLQTVNDKPVQILHPPEEIRFTIKYDDISETGNASEAEVTDYYYKKAFDLSRAPLLRVGIVKTTRANYILMLVMHHIISDLHSYGVFEKDFSDLQKGLQLPPLRIQYKDYSEWQAGEKEKDNLIQQETYWLNVFEGEIPELKIPTDFPRSGQQGVDGSALIGELLENTEAIKKLARENDATTFIVLLAICNVFLYKLSGQEDVVMGTVVAGRGHTDLEKIIGMFVNTLPLRNRPCGEHSFLQFLREVREGTLAAFDNQEYQFEDLVEQLPVDRNRHNPLFDVLFTCTEQEVDEGTGRNHEDKNATPSGETVYEHRENQTARFELNLTFVVEKRLLFSFAYSSKLFRRETIELFVNAFKEIITAILEEPDIKLKDISVTAGIGKSDIAGVREELEDMDF
ncbi:MAG: AMP-binding protein, partial [bacterium]|nr:AMP-binding protein [bacterium]